MNEASKRLVSSGADRLDVFLSEAVDGLSRSRAKRLIEEGLVKIDGSPSVKPSSSVKPGQVVEVEIPAPAPEETAAEDVPLDVVYEDDDVIVVNKPRGMVVHPAPGHPGGTLANALIGRCPELAAFGGLRPGMVHRLDKDTSGLLAVAKNEASRRSLVGQLAARQVLREYIAIAEGRWSKTRRVPGHDWRLDSLGRPAGRIASMMGRHPRHRKRMAVLEKEDAPRGKEALTEYLVLEEFAEHLLLQCRLLTGRTHQIRVHLAYIGHPVVGDRTYGGRRGPFEIRGQALHSHRLRFSHPRTGLPVDLSAPLPADMRGILDAISP